jgi:FixJ family two-component response regulator
MNVANGPGRPRPGKAGPDLSVLVVDDEPMLAEELADGLREEGFEVDTANSAIAALAALRADPGIGVLVSDIRMPGGTGLALAAEVLGKGPEASARGVILITAHGSMDQAVEAMRSGVSDFLTKPFSLEDAARAVRAAMERTLARRAAAAERAATDLRLQQAEETSTGLSDRLTQALERLQAARPSLPPEAGETENRLRLLAHELRTPLVPVIGYAELLEGGHAKTPEDAQSYGLYLREAGERMLETVDKLLTWEGLRSQARRTTETVDTYGPAGGARPRPGHLGRHPGRSRPALRGGRLGADPQAGRPRPRPRHRQAGGGTPWRAAEPAASAGGRDRGGPRAAGRMSRPT